MFHEQLAEACLGQNAAKTAPVLIAVMARTDTWRQHSRMALEQWPEENCRMRRLWKLSRKSLVTMILVAGKRSDKGLYNRQYRFDREGLVHYL